MGTRSNLYAGQPGTSPTTLVTSPASTTTTITYANAKNTSDAPVFIGASMSGVEVIENMLLPPKREATLFGVVNGTLNAAQTLTVTCSVAAVIDVKIDGYQKTTA